MPTSRDKLAMREQSRSLPTPKLESSLLQNLTSGFVIGVITITYCLSFSVMIFAGDMVDIMPYGITAAIIGAIASVLIVSHRSSLRGATAGPDTPTMAVVAAMVVAISSKIQHMESSALHDHVMASIVSSTVITGIVLLIIGYSRMGQWMRFIPYPVVGGFLAASGWLLCLGAVKVLTGIRPGLSELANFTDMNFWYHLLPGACFAIILTVARRVFSHQAVVPIFIIVGLLVAWLILGATDSKAVSDPLWFLPPINEFAYWSPLDAAIWQQLDWGSLILHGSEIGAITGVTAIAIMLNATGLEVDQRVHVNIDRELSSNGFANLFSGLLGGMIGNLSLNRSRLSIQSGANSPIAGYVAALTCLVFLAIGNNLTQFVATPIIGGLLLYLGFSMLLDWLVRVRERLSSGDYGLVIAMCLCIVNLGFLEGAILGVIASTIMFALRYSRIRPIKHYLTAAECSSYLERSAEDRKFLNEHGTAIQVFKLQGYLFFGSSNNVFEVVRDKTASNLHGFSAVLLDFRLVSGVDSSAVFSFNKLKNHLQKTGHHLYISTATPIVRRKLGWEGGKDSENVSIFPSLERALEQAEEDLLVEFREIKHEEDNLEAWFMEGLNNESAAMVVTEYLERLEFEDGEYICKQGDPSDAIYFSVSGRISIELETENQESVRLRSMLNRTMIGEMGFFRHMRRAASVRTERHAVVYRLSRDSFNRMQIEAPSVCVIFQNYVIHTLSNRLDFANKEVSALQR